MAKLQQSSVIDNVGKFAMVLIHVYFSNFFLGDLRLISHVAKSSATEDVRCGMTSVEWDFGFLIRDAG